MIIRIDDFQSRNIQITNGPPLAADRKEQICYDLHVGESVRIPGNDTRRPPPVPIRLWPNDCLRIETREHFTIPVDVFGVLCSRASLTAEGLVAANLKIDPRFQGKLVITVYNASKNIITINPALPFCSIFFASLEHPLDPSAPTRIPPEAKIITGAPLVEWLLRWRPQIITFVLSVIASLIASYLFVWTASVKKANDTKQLPVAPESKSAEHSTPETTPKNPK